MKRKVPVEELCDLCKRNGRDIHSVSWDETNEDRNNMISAMERKRNRAEVANLIHCSPGNIHSWLMGVSTPSLTYYELLAYKWRDKKGLAYARKLSEGTQNEDE